MSDRDRLRVMLGGEPEEDEPVMRPVYMTEQQIQDLRDALTAAIEDRVHYMGGYIDQDFTEPEEIEEYENQLVRWQCHPIFEA